MENQEFKQKEEKRENQFPTLAVSPIMKPIWFLIKLKHNVKIIEDKYKRYTEVITLVQFENIEESNNYFQLINNDKEVEFVVLANYTEY